MFRRLSHIVCIVLLAWGIGSAAAATVSKPFTIPEIREWSAGKGYFQPRETTRIVCSSSASDELLQVAERFAEDYAVMFGQRLPVVQGRGTKGDFIFALADDKGLGEEGYAVRITDRVQLTASTTRGLYWGTRTLLQLAEQNEMQTLPSGTIRDWPDYAFRGFMLDCGRKFIPLDYLRKLVRIMAYYKLNVLQIHLNDNGFKQYYEHNWDKTYSAFRLESETFPGLTARDGSYSKREFIDLQQEAAACGVEIIPEIDIPAHSLAFTQYMPEIGSREYGMDHLDLFAPETYRFADALFREYLTGDEPVFIGPRVHIGTDEYSNARKEVVEQFRAFTDHYIRLVEELGKQAVVWGALTHAAGETPVKADSVIMSAWYNGYADPAAMMEAGYKLVSIPDGMVYIVPAAGYYHDYLDEAYLYDHWTPAHIGQAVFEERHPSILGGMFAVWNDHVGNGISVKDIHHRLFPALQTLSAKMWDGANVSFSYPAFDSLRQPLAEAPGINERARIGLTPTCVYTQAEVLPGDTLPFTEIGYDYTVSFDIEGGHEGPGTVLFRSPNATFYLSDPIGGMMGFARDGYLNTFRYRVLPGEKAHIRIEGDNRSTTLYVNDRLVEEMNIQRRYYNSGRDSMNYVLTLVFPLEEAGRFNSRIHNLTIENYRVSRSASPARKEETPAR